MAAVPPVVGVVEAFDADRGYGTVAATGGDRWFFHCTALADGSRTVAVGTRVAFVVGPGAPGRWEARSVVPLE